MAEELIDIDEVAKLAGISRNTIYRRIVSDTFPKPQKVPSPHIRGPRTVNRWRKEDILNWRVQDDAYFRRSQEKHMRGGGGPVIDPTLPNVEYYFEPDFDMGKQKGRIILNFQPSEAKKWRIKPMFITAAIAGILCGILWGISQ